MTNREELERDLTDWEFREPRRDARTLVESLAEWLIKKGWRKGVSVEEVIDLIEDHVHEDSSFLHMIRDKIRALAEQDEGENRHPRGRNPDDFAATERGQD